MSVFDYTDAMEEGVGQDPKDHGPLWRYMEALGLTEEEAPEDDGFDRYGNGAGDFI